MSSNNLIVRLVYDIRVQKCYCALYSKSPAGFPEIFFIVITYSGFPVQSTINCLTFDSYRVNYIFMIAYYFLLAML